MSHQFDADKDIAVIPGCYRCGGGDRVELAAGLGVVVDGHIFHTDCVVTDFGRPKREDDDD